MNAIRMLALQPWVERLGWTLVHFLWQGALIALLYAGARGWMGRGSTANGRYVLACAALAAMMAAPVATWIAMHQGEDVTPRADRTARIPAASFPAPAPLPAAVYRTVPGVPPAQFLPWVVMAWLTGATVFWVRLAGSWMMAARMRSMLVRPAPEQWQQVLARLSARIGLTRPVRMLVSALVDAPAVVGWVRPLVLVPVGALSGLPAEYIEALLVHELAHIRRHDYLVNCLQSAAEALLFYHPAIWWVSGHIRAERELCCDDAAVCFSGDVFTYARALAELESARPAHFGTIMAANGGSLANRIARLLGQSRPASRRLSGSGIAAAAMLLAVTAFAVFGQPAARPKFEVASVKPAREVRFRMVRTSPGGLTASAPVLLLIQNAYGVQPFQIVGGPEWMRSEHYEIEAKADSKASRSQVFLMLRSLLDDRFQLKIHRETRELPVYALVAARGGLNLPPPKDGSCVASPAADAPAEWAGGRMSPPGQAQPLGRCGDVRVMLEPTGARMQGGKVPMPELVRMLSMVLGRAVIDRTGFTELFDVQLDFVPDETTAALPPPPPDSAAASPEFNNRSILVAMQEQLGLRMESTKGPVDVIVIDHVERPGAN